MDPRAPRSPEGLPDRPPGTGTLVMGILNVTPDSFSDGGLHGDTASALAHARRLLAEGADVVDVGGESTRPGAQRVTEEEERRRVLPVVRALAAEGAVVGVDTMRAAVAAEAVAAGALLVNDVSGGLADPAMAGVVAALRTSRGGPPVYVAMHWRGHADVMGTLTAYDDPARDVARDLAVRLTALREGGIPASRLVVDPGLGFAKTAEQSWEVLARWEELEVHGLPVLVGASRKRFLGVAGVAGADLTDRDAATAAVSAYAAEHGAWAVRVHAVPPSLAAVRVGDRLRRSRR